MKKSIAERLCNSACSVKASQHWARHQAPPWPGVPGDHGGVYRRGL